ncbi:MAG TPA: hypothetical protein VK638_13275 [Edaphobacter sp.]|nr:hypothetical protein [Edaphobacter sp.]
MAAKQNATASQGTSLKASSTQRPATIRTLPSNPVISIEIIRFRVNWLVRAEVTAERTGFAEYELRIGLLVDGIVVVGCGEGAAQSLAISCCWGYGYEQKGWG